MDSDIRLKHPARPQPHGEEAGRCTAMRTEAQDRRHAPGLPRDLSTGLTFHAAAQLLSTLPGALQLTGECAAGRVHQALASLSASSHP